MARPNRRSGTRTSARREERFKSVAVELGESLRRRRKRLGLSQEKAAELAGLHPVQLSRIECGQTNVTLASLSAIADAYDTDARSLFPRSR